MIGNVIDVLRRQKFGCMTTAANANQIEWEVHVDGDNMDSGVGSTAKPI